MTDLLASPDGGEIKWVKDRTYELVEEKRMEMPGEQLDEDDPVSKSTRRIVLLNAYGKAWEEFRTTKHEFIMKVALRTGNVFSLCDD